MHDVLRLDPLNDVLRLDPLKSDYLRIIRRRVRRIFRVRRFVDDLTFRVLLLFPLPPRPSIFPFPNGLDDTNTGSGLSE